MAGRLIPMRVGDVEILVETVVAPGSEPTSRLSDAGERVAMAFDHVRDAISQIAVSTAHVMTDLAGRAVDVSQMELEFGLKFSTQGNVVLAGASGEASLLVRVVYQQGKPSSEEQTAQ